MTKSNLNPGQLRTVEIIEALGFGVIERLLISEGTPCFDPEPTIIQTIKLDSAPKRQPAPNSADITLRKEFENLFDRFSRLRDGAVNVEIRHGVPFRLVVTRSYTGIIS
jgi:hypothetical protein